MRAPRLLILSSLVAASLLSACASDSSIREARQRSDQQYAQSSISEEDVTAEIQFGRELAARILARYQMSNDQELIRYLNLVGKNIASHSDRPELNFHFTAIVSDEINAYAAPGGYIFVTTGAIKEMRDEAELAAVLAHEIGHVTEKHIVRAIGIKGADSSALSGISKLLGASNDPSRVAFSQAMDKALNYLFENGLQAEDEYQADSTGTLLLTQTGYDPTALQRYLDRVKKQRKQLNIVNKTHPSFDSRLVRIDQLLTMEALSSEPNKVYTQRFNAQTKF
ncbi:Peptidase family M48 [Oceanospirillum multiglobuliferum]|uniref:Peptidase M48 domain-containing protein n=1 Tax=Oceanospirillum multiglobuliferum TaxID=64969 RepID=A0A1T4MR93_9GAMM|nr:M48 family metalloprotease [Oceanospirillum multiglobuliferum]OPX56923.1 hypothetical protein BTE48_00350 [Oceanospirillum multiglobuliferum]SJZ69314.1 Peptidase family M48 [Oceanospirillum multiglobuliferum]